MKRIVLLSLLCAGVLVASCDRKRVPQPEDPEVLELRSKTPIPLMSLAGTAWITGDYIHFVKLDERGIIIPEETSIVTNGPSLPWGPYVSAWTFDEGTITAYGCFRFESGATKELWFKRSVDLNTGAAQTYSVDEQKMTVTAPALGQGSEPLKIYIFNPEEVVLLASVPNGYHSLSLRPASSQEQKTLSAAKGRGEAGFAESYEAALAAVEQNCKDQGMSEAGAAEVKAEFEKAFKGTFGE